jgi:predicted Zn-dependent protease
VQFHVVQDSTVNAMALPGGHIVLTTGMASLLHRDEELLAALLSHEMAHAFCRHTERKLESMITICSAVGAMRINAHRGAGGGRYMDVDVGMRYLRNRYAREQEREADEMALRYLVAAGYSPQAFVRLLHLLAPLAEAPKPPDYIVSHDPPSRRLARIAAVVQPPRMEKGTPREQ